MRRFDERGFTLIELMVVVAIIAILAGILIPNFVNARAQAQSSACESNLRSIATALELMYADRQSYVPPTSASGQTFPATPANFTANNVVYLNNTPKDPAALDQTQDYQVTASDQANGAAPTYTIQCPGTHVGSTLAKIVKSDGTGVCGPNCAATQIRYVAGAGLQVQ